MSENDKPPMYEYLLTGRNARGRRVTEIVEAESADRAVAALAERGYGEVVLHTDDVAALFEKPSKSTLLFTPRQLVAARSMGPTRSVILVTAKFYAALWFVMLPAVGWIIYRRISEVPWDLWDAVAATALAFPIPWVLGVFIWNPAVRSNFRMLRAVGWAHWEEVLRLLPKLRDDSPFALPLRRAQALAGLGRLEDGLAVWEAFRGVEGMPEYTFWGFQSTIYQAAREREKVLEARARAHAANPTSVSILIDYASCLLIRNRDTRRARELVTEARAHAVSDRVMPYLLATEGLLDLEEGRPADAVARISEAVRQLAPFLRGDPSSLSSAAELGAYLCLAHAATGDSVAARRRLAEARPLLTAHGEYDLLRRCEEAVG